MFNYSYPHIPDKWLVIKTPDCYKVFTSNKSGYLESDTWQVNSGIKEIENNDDYFIFKGYSGSVYKCYKNRFGITLYGQGVLESITEKNPQIEVINDLNLVYSLSSFL